jgi:hypothetical protein
MPYGCFYALQLQGEIGFVLLVQVLAECAPEMTVPAAYPA